LWGDWEAEPLRCSFCGERNHEHLGSLVSPESLEREQIEICDSCRSYIKTIRTLAPIRPAQVLLQNLATVALDDAADHGYERPGPRKRRVAVSVVARPSRLQALLRFRR
jgi:formate dehydrogenase maturation protein FdhE